MSPRLRIQAIRLMDKLKKNPELAREYGIKASLERKQIQKRYVIR